MFFSSYTKHYIKGCKIRKSNLINQIKFHILIDYLHVTPSACKYSFEAQATTLPFLASFLEMKPKTVLT